MTSDVQTETPAASTGLEDRYLILRKRGLQFSQENRRSFTLIPFDAPGIINDPAAIEALKAYAIATKNGQLRSDILAWLELSDLHVFDCDDEYVVASSFEEAEEIMTQTCGADDDRGPESWDQLSDEAEFEFEGVKKPAWQWCIEHGKGYFCSGNL